MQRITSLIYTVLLFVSCAVAIIISFFLTRKQAIQGFKRWARVNLWLMERLMDLRYRLLDEHLNLLQEACSDQPVIYAVKHQSTWETVALFNILNSPIVLLKAELLRIPLFGMMVRRAGLVAVNRKRYKAFLQQLPVIKEQMVREKRHLVIFPEGTRSSVGKPTVLKRGIVDLAKYLELPVVPVALNSGVFWGRRSLVKQKGVVSVMILEPCYYKDFESDEAFLGFLAKVLDEGCKKIENMEKTS